jgi:hypothetical protein
MSERAALIGATLTIENSNPRGGVRVRLEVPLDELEELGEFEPLAGAGESREIGEAR